MPKAGDLGTCRDMLVLIKGSIFYWEPKFDVFQRNNALAGSVVGGCDGALHLQVAAATQCVDVWCIKEVVTQCTLAYPTNLNPFTIVGWRTQIQ